MSGLDGLRLDADGYLDMDQFPDDGTDLAGAELDQLRAVLHADPVEEPTAEQWDAIFDEVVATDDAGPFGVDGVDALVTDLDGGDDPFGLDDADPAASDADLDDDAGTAPDDDLAADDDLALDDPDLALDDATADDLDLDLGPDLDGGLDLAPDDAVDDAFSAEALDDAPADIAHDFEDLL